MSKRKRYTAEEKVKILREVLEDGKPISQVADKYGLHPNNIFNWRKQLFETGIQTFSNIIKNASNNFIAFIKSEETLEKQAIEDKKYNYKDFLSRMSFTKDSKSQTISEYIESNRDRHINTDILRRYL